MAVAFLARQLEYLANRGDANLLVEGPKDQNVVVVVARSHDGQRFVGRLGGPQRHERFVVAVPRLGLHAKAAATEHVDDVPLGNKYFVGLLGLLRVVQVDGRLHRSLVKAGANFFFFF